MSVQRTVIPPASPPWNTHTPRAQPKSAALDVHVEGRFLFAGGEKLLVRGATYGTFAGPDDLPDRKVVSADLAAMRAAGLNALRTYTVPPGWLLDLAAENGLRVLAGLPWPQHVTFLDSRRCRRDIVRSVAEGARRCAGHPALLALSIGNEIPAGIARWHGADRIERFLGELSDAARNAAQEALITYVNFPTTEYLELPFLDFLAFNVFLEERREFEDYVTYLSLLAGERPLMITELGLDSRRHGPEQQALALGGQVRSAFARGCAGAFAFSWTDEWSRDGVAVEDWDFGLVDRQRRPKPALAAAAGAFRSAGPQPARLPAVSVVICTHNGARTLGECLDGVAELRYPDYEVLVIDDGSSDGSAELASTRGARVIPTPPRGLSAARNAGIDAATGEIIAFLDDDCRPDPDWLGYAVAELLRGRHAGVGGPNLSPPGESLVARAVARAPGLPTHVLSATDSHAEHIAGCNMVFDRRTLIDLGGFDEQFQQAGDDVDLCWRIAQAGLTLGFSPSAVVWHRRRATVRAYLRQQRSYGRAEALLERTWPGRHNGAGHVTWSGQVYGGSLRPRGRRRRIHHGVWGEGLFQPAARPPASIAAVAPLMPEWYLLVGILAAAAAISPWLPMVRIANWRAPLAPALLVLTVLGLAASALRRAWPAIGPQRSGRARRVRDTGVLAWLVLTQPLARLSGRLGAGLTPWRGQGTLRLDAGLPRTVSVWWERGASTGAWLRELEGALQNAGAAVSRGGPFDRWDLRVRVGALGAARVRMAIEEHGHGRQLVRYRIAPTIPHRALKLVLALLGMCALEAATANLAGLLVVGLSTLLVILRSAEHCAAASLSVSELLRRPRTEATAGVLELGSMIEPGPVAAGVREL